MQDLTPLLVLVTPLLASGDADRQRDRGARDRHTKIKKKGRASAPFDLAATRAAGMGKVFLFNYNHAADYASLIVVLG